MISLPLTVDQGPQTNVFCVPSLDPSPAEEVSTYLTEEIQRIYNFCFFCLNNTTQIRRGSLFITLVYDLSKKNIKILDSKGEKAQVNKIKASSYTSDGKCISLKWIFEFKDHNEAYNTS